MKMFELTCPGCGAQMTYNAAERTASCEYCGKLILLINDSSSETFSPTKNEKMTEEELAEKRRKNLLKAQAISDGYKNFNWEEDRADFNLTSQNAWRRAPVDFDRSFWDWDPEYSYNDVNWGKILAVLLFMIFLFVLKMIK